MSPTEHIAEAERILEEDDPANYTEQRIFNVAKALVHATLAVAMRTS